MAGEVLYSLIWLWVFQLGPWFSHDLPAYQVDATYQESTGLRVAIPGSSTLYKTPLPFGWFNIKTSGRWYSLESVSYLINSKKFCRVGRCRHHYTRNRTKRWSDS